MNPIRVMVVDDSVVVRKIVTDVLSEDRDIEVVGTAVNGKVAFEADAYDDDGGWSVVVKGSARILTTGAEIAKLERPELTSAKVIVSGGRALQNGETSRP